MTRIASGLLGAAVAALCLAAHGGSASAATINLATGFSGGTLAASGNQADDHWTVANADNSEHAPTAFTVFPADTDFGDWVANGPRSNWIAADPNVTDNGNATYTLTFDLTSAQAASASISGGAWAIDDAGALSLNGHVLSTLGDGNYSSLNAFSATSADFVAGVNTLVMQTTNADDFIEGARLEGAVNYSAGVVSDGAPEPALWAMLILGLGMTGAAARRRRPDLAVTA